ncbi:MAG: hypothetical protein C4539_20410 [Ignavibacteriales bacterium]|nr:MAG: hypothetical protein C4539_20410 [Ignavibacteriales bacterium]
MPSYYVNKNDQSTGEHEVHKDGCTYLPEEQNRKYLGVYSNCQDAIKEAKKDYYNVDGCYYCCYECHKR